MFANAGGRGGTVGGVGCGGVDVGGGAGAGTGRAAGAGAVLGGIVVEGGVESFGCVTRCLLISGDFSGGASDGRLTEAI